MANENFEALFTTYQNRNAELRSVAKSAYEFGHTIAQEPSSALSSGLDEHAVRRQRQYLDYIEGMVNAMHAKPIPDMPGIHPTGFAINMSRAYKMFVEDVNGENIPLNEQTRLLAEYWMLTAVELARSQSASLAGSLTDYDHDRAIGNIGVMRKLLDEMTARPMLDLPETAVPGAELTQTGAIVKKAGA